MALISIRGLSTVFGPRPKEVLALARAGQDKASLLAGGHTVGLLDVDLDVEAGEIFVVMGLSGSGKSTLVRHINRLISPTAGSVSIDGVDVMSLSGADLVTLRRQRLSMVFQGFGLLAHRRVVDNVAYGLEVRGVPTRERHRRAMAWIERVGLSGFEQRYPVQLSGGMRQRVGLARALCADTDIILMDEAFSALDPMIRAQLQEELIKLQAELGKTIVFITHDLDEALRIGSRVAILRDGRLVQVGTPHEVLLQPADAEIRSFVQDVNRARALPVGLAADACEVGQASVDPHRVVDWHASLETVIPHLIGCQDPLFVRKNQKIVGTVSMPMVRELLSRHPS